MLRGQLRASYEFYCLSRCDYMQECLVFVDSVHGLHGVLAAGLSLLAAEKGLAVLIETHVGHLNVTGMNGDLGLLTVHLLSLDLLNMNAPSAAVDLGDFALTSFVRATHNLHCVSVADGDTSGEPLCRKVLAKLSRHNLTAERGGGREVGLAGLSALAGHLRVGLHL